MVTNGGVPDGALDDTDEGIVHGDFVDWLWMKERPFSRRQNNGHSAN